MPDQPQCNETSWVYLGSENEAITGGESQCGSNEEYSCLWLEFIIVPFQVSVQRRIGDALWGAEERVMPPNHRSWGRTALRGGPAAGLYQI